MAKSRAALSMWTSCRHEHELEAVGIAHAELAAAVLGLVQVLEKRRPGRAPSRERRPDGAELPRTIQRIQIVEARRIEPQRDERMRPFHNGLRHQAQVAEREHRPPNRSRL